MDAAVCFPSTLAFYYFLRVLVSTICFTAFCYGTYVAVCSSVVGILNINFPSWTFQIHRWTFTNCILKKKKNNKNKRYNWYCILMIKKNPNNTPSLPKKTQKENTMSCLIRVLSLNSLFEKQVIPKGNAYYHNTSHS